MTVISFSRTANTKWRWKSAGLLIYHQTEVKPLEKNRKERPCLNFCDDFCNKNTLLALVLLLAKSTCCQAAIWHESFHIQSADWTKLFEIVQLLFTALQAFLGRINSHAIWKYFARDVFDKSHENWNIHIRLPESSAACWKEIHKVKTWLATIKQFRSQKVYSISKPKARVWPVGGKGWGHKLGGGAINSAKLI